MKYTTILLIVMAGLITSCQDTSTGKSAPSTVDATEKTAEATTEPMLATSLVKAIAAHGGTLYDEAYYGFVFREQRYTFKNSNTGFVYTRLQEKDGQTILDSLTNEGVERYIDGNKQSLTEKQKASYSEGVNSVIYFATLPHKLQDPAVNTEALGEIKIADQNYTILKVSFDQEGGGKDFEDNYRYWINTETDRIDYLAYDYRVNGGGVRFRSAYNPRVVDGILFQDYVNYKAVVGTPLDSLPAMFEAGKLEELSKIETEEVVSLAP